jgi:hypothetical protein
MIRLYSGSKLIQLLSSNIDMLGIKFVEDHGPGSVNRFLSKGLRVYSWIFVVVLVLSSLLIFILLGNGQSRIRVFGANCGVYFLLFLNFLLNLVGPLEHVLNLSPLPQVLGTDVIIVNDIECLSA